MTLSFPDRQNISLNKQLLELVSVWHRATAIKPYNRVHIFVISCQNLIWKYNINKSKVRGMIIVHTSITFLFRNNTYTSELLLISNFCTNDVVKLKILFSVSVIMYSCIEYISFFSKIRAIFRAYNEQSEKTLFTFDCLVI
jgi:hypothetical protein